MNNIGIIAEYNPFHKGHLYHLDETKKIGQADHVVALMSGNFTQRGEPAMYDKLVRAEMAVRNGVDLVIELPFIFACNNAEFFAMGAIKILNELGCISHFSFGSESGDLDKLVEVADELAFESADFKKTLKKYLEMGFSFPKSRYEAMKELKGSEKAEIIVDPNNILAVEYLKQWIRLKSHMQPMTIKRLGGGYHNKDSSVSMAGASAIRKKMALSLDVESVRHALPDTSADVMNRNIHQTIIDSEKLFPYLAYKVLTSDREYLSEIISSGEGLENRLKRAIIGSKSTEDIVRFILSKRYTETRVKRLLIHTLVSLKRKDFFRIIESPALYARVLGFSPKGAELIRYIKRERCSHIPIVTNINKELTKENPVWEILSYDILATDIYNLAHFGGIYQRSDYVLKPFFEECF